MNATLARRRPYALEFLGGHCAVCGSTENLEIDHVDPETKTPRLRARGRHIEYLPYALFIEELEKCQLLCFRCHVDKSARERAIRAISRPCPQGHPREEHAFYDRHGYLRCRACTREWSRIAMRERRAKEKLVAQAQTKKKIIRPRRAT
jgi:HNH endonuclease.